MGVRVFAGFVVLVGEVVVDLALDQVVSGCVWFVFFYFLVEFLVVCGLH